MIDRPCLLRQIVSVYFREHRVAVDSDGVQVPATDEEGGEGCVKGVGAQVFAVPAVDLYYVDIVWWIAFVVVGDIISCRREKTIQKPYVYCGVRCAGDSAKLGFGGALRIEPVWTDGV